MLIPVKLLIDSELGEVLFRRNTNSNSYTIRICQGKIKVTIPFIGDYKTAYRFFLQNRDVLLTKMKTQSRPAPLSEMEIWKLKESAASVLPGKLASVAKKFGFRYQICQIGQSRTAWGSCSVSGKIILSCYLMLLPEKLIEYVLIHELCHTVHPNHSAAFWTLVNKYTAEDMYSLRSELRNFRIP